MQGSLIGVKFGRWTVVSAASPDKVGRKRWDCICECGRTSIVGDYSLKIGQSTSCRRHPQAKRDNRTTVRLCIQCGKAYQLPICRLKRRALCSAECREAHSDKHMDSKRKMCLICAQPFYPRPSQVRNGQGKVCSTKCRSEHFKSIPRTEEWRKNTSIAQKGRAGKCGPANHNWKGGYRHCYAQRLADGRIAASVKRYRSRHPEKVRDWEQNRHGRKTGRLPKGTVADLLLKQGNRCACCQNKLRQYHVDHVVPLARGGEHKRSNVQILCPTCNVRKSAKDPVAFMQERGFLF